MNKSLYILDSPLPRYSSLRFRTHSRSEVASADKGRSVKGIINSLEARIMYKEGTKAPLGDFPGEEDRYLIMSQKAVDVFWTEIDAFFDKIPIQLTGGGEIKRSEIWYEKKISEMPAIPGINDAYYYMHPCRTLLRSSNEPVELEEYMPRDLSKAKIDINELEKKLKEVSEKYQGKLNEALIDIGTKPLPPIFAVGEFAEIYFTDEFKALCKNNKLKGIKLAKVDNSDKTNG